MTLALLALLACGGREEAPRARGVARTTPDALPMTEAPAVPGCLTWRGPPTRLSSAGDAVTRHHPTVTRRGDGLVVAWQVGKSPAALVARVFDDGLTARGAEETVSAADDVRATHPQVATAGGDAVLAWTDDATGALKFRPLGVDGGPAGEVAVLQPAGEKAMYPDVDHGPSGERAVVWYTGEAPGPPAYRWAWWEGPAAPAVHRLDLAPEVYRGGPPAVGFDRAGVPWILWPELRKDGAWGRARVRMGRLEGGHVVDAVDVIEAPMRFERPAVAFLDGGVGVAWTRYAVGDQPWGVWVRLLDAARAPVGEAVELGVGGRMIDAAALGDRLVVAWEAVGEGFDVVTAVFSADGQQVCGPVPAHAPHPGDQTRANLVTWAADGGWEGALVWQGNDARGGAAAVWGRRFGLRP